MREASLRGTFPRVSIGVSACLLGQKVRYDGGHKRDAFLIGPLAKFVDYLPVCPEAAVGLGIPRPPIQLVGVPGHPRAVGVRDPALDVTGRLEDFARQTVPRLQQISGYVLKKDSPSCGMERVKLYGEPGHMPERKATGVFARVIQESLPLLPLEEEGRLNDPVLRENFINRVYAYRRWQQLETDGLTRAGLIAFHTRHKYLVMAHSQAAYQRLGRLLSDLSREPMDRIAHAYIHELMTALKRRVNPKRHSNVLQHIMGYLKRSLDQGDKAELLRTIEAYRREEVPLIVPITLLRHYFRRHPDPYMQGQYYLCPHPDALSLRNAL